MRAICMFSLGLLVLVVPGVAQAASVVPISSIPSIPAPVLLGLPAAASPIPGLKLTTKEGPGPTVYHALTAATGRGYCIAGRGTASWWAGTYEASARAGSEDLDLDRLLEKDGTVILERTRVLFDPPSGTITATGRSQVTLMELARTAAGVVVWGFREDRAVVLLARGVTGGNESRQLRDSAAGERGDVSAEGCSFAGGRVDARKPEAGAIAQLLGSSPAVGKGKNKVVPRFAIDASVSRVARDPEPLLAVRVRTLEP